MPEAASQDERGPGGVPDGHQGFGTAADGATGPLQGTGCALLGFAYAKADPLTQDPGRRTRTCSGAVVGFPT